MAKKCAIVVANSNDRKPLKGGDDSANTALWRMGRCYSLLAIFRASKPHTFGTSYYTSGSVLRSLQTLQTMTRFASTAVGELRRITAVLSFNPIWELVVIDPKILPHYHQDFFSLEQSSHGVLGPGSKKRILSISIQLQQPQLPCLPRIRLAVIAHLLSTFSQPSKRSTNPPSPELFIHNQPTSSTPYYPPRPALPAHISFPPAQKQPGLRLYTHARRTA